VGLDGTGINCYVMRWDWQICPMDKPGIGTIPFFWNFCWNRNFLLCTTISIDFNSEISFPLC